MTLTKGPSKIGLDLDVRSAATSLTTVSNAKSEVGTRTETGSVVRTGAAILSELASNSVRTTRHTGWRVLGSNTIDVKQAQCTKHCWKKVTHIEKMALSRRSRTLRLKIEKKLKPVF